MLTYDEILEQALKLTRTEQEALIDALEDALNKMQALTPLGRLAQLARSVPRTGVPSNISDHADDVVNELMRKHLIDHADQNTD